MYTVHLVISLCHTYYVETENALNPRLKKFPFISFDYILCIDSAQENWLTGRKSLDKWKCTLISTEPHQKHFNDCIWYYNAAAVIENEIIHAHTRLSFVLTNSFSFKQKPQLLVSTYAFCVRQFHGTN